MLPDDDKRYAIETCRSSESVLKKWFKNKLHTISAFVDCVIIIESHYMFNITTVVFDGPSHTFTSHTWHLYGKSHRNKIIWN